MTRTLLELMVRPTGPDIEPISFETFLAELRPFQGPALAAGLTTVSWMGWQGQFPTETENTLAVALADRIAVLAMACGAVDGIEPSISDIVTLHTRYLAVDSTSDSLVDAQATELARLACGEAIAILVPDWSSARDAVMSFTIARLLRVQWLPGRSRFDELSRTWWLARRIDEQAAHLDRATAMLGMSVPTFVRAASALISLAVTSEPNHGRVDLNRQIDQSFIDKYDVDADVLRLAAFKLSTSRIELQDWLRDLIENAPPDLLNYAPTPLASTPLVRVDEFMEPRPLAHSVFLCPSLYQFMGAIRDRVKEAISLPGPMSVDTKTLYGELLNKYVASCMADTGKVIDVDSFDRNDRRADWLLVCHDVGLIIEVKRALATGSLSRHLVTPEGMAAVLKQLYGAYEQCRATRSRARWESRCGRLQQLAALILVDEPVGAEGAVVAHLLSRQTAVGLDPPFEVMSVAEFENAIHVLGVKRLVSLIHEKWRMNKQAVPLGVFYTKVLGEDRLRAENMRPHLEQEDRELFLDLKLSASGSGVMWPL